MTDEYLTFDELAAQGWSLNQGKGVTTPTFTSLSLRLVRDERLVKYVQGYGKTHSEALADAVAEANTWLEAERIVQSHQDDSPNRRRRR